MDIVAFFTDYTTRTIALGTLILGISCGLLGSFAVLRKQSLLGDAISHAALPGIAVAFLITKSKDANVLLLGALVSGLIGVVWIKEIISKTHLKTDTALGLILSLFFGFGMLLLSYIQKIPNANQAGLDTFLFGQAATLLMSDVWRMAIVTVISCTIVVVFWKEIKLMLFDPEFAKTLGFKFKTLDYLLSFLIVVAIVIGLQTVGVILMSALILAPAAAARQWTDSLRTMVILAACFGGVSGVLGTAISSDFQHVSTGPVIVLVALFFVGCSFLFSPSRGWLFTQLRIRRNRSELELQKTLYAMYHIALEHEDMQHPHEIKILNNFMGFTRSRMRKMVEMNLITIQGSQWSLTLDGIERASNLYNQNEKGNVSRT